MNQRNSDVFQQKTVKQLSVNVGVYRSINNDSTAT